MFDSAQIPNQADGWSEWAALASPLFRWAGGKQRFLWDHAGKIPSVSGVYHEPFAGGLSVFFHVVRSSASPVKARLADLNLRLVRTYQEIQMDWRGVDDRLRQIVAAFLTADDKEAFYYEIRRQHNEVSPASDAARFIFLMDTCWNGVFRINKDGQFNVPMGASKVKSPRFPSSEQIRAVHEVFKFASIRACSWESSLAHVQPGDFVFLDPPYFSNQRGDLYEKGRQFGLEQHENLARHLEDFQRRGIDFLLTNAASKEMKDLYKSHGLTVQQIEMHRSISVRTTERVAAEELLVTPNFSINRDTRVEAELELLVNVRRRRIQKGDFS